ncbi:AI-2E family transporter [Nitratireductor mangrovi]|uniref:AI-2E family transporter n=1 Tax=Nitratireductor mangrovi TaxID=2599600 RepID=A0A5B8L3L9_9HYPH|nr:AI-2E family transporter [Nitratireductor mangrovi]QDZ02138.1 AI-2E family transporter [Nitratireductor mangrovi]
MKPFLDPRPAGRWSWAKPDLDTILARAAVASIVLLGVLGFVVALIQGQFILAPVTLAVVVGLMLGPVATRLERRGLRAWLSAAIVVLLFIVLVCAVLLALIGPLTYWAGELPRIWERLQFQLAQLREPINTLKELQSELRSVTGGSQVTVQVDEGAGVEDVAVMAPALVAQLLLFMASLFFFIATRHDIRLGILRFCLDRRLRWRVAHIFRDVEALVSRYLLSIAVINAGLGVAVTLALWAVGVPSPALWGAFAALLNFVIYIGPTVMVALLFGVGLSTFDTLGGSFVPPLAYLSVNLVEAQFVTPMVLGRTLTLNPFLVLLALAFWIWVWGPIGGFVAIPALLIVYAIVSNIFPAVRQARGD